MAALLLVFPGYNPDDPTQDTESPIHLRQAAALRLSYNPDDPTQDTESHGQDGHRQLGAGVTIQTIRHRILKGDGFATIGTG